MDILHWIIAIAVVVVVLFYQLKYRKEILKNLSEYIGIFNGIKGQITISDGEIVSCAKLENLQAIDQQIVEKQNELTQGLIFGEDEINHQYSLLCDLQQSRIEIVNQDKIAVGGEIFQLIISNLNNYLRKNINSVADYHLMKDIIDRNCEVKEEEISTQLPFPLYAGLVGTMLGIIVGVITLAFGLGDNINVQSITPLLTCVGLAMIASAVGIIITTYCSNKYKDAQKQLAKDKDEFLSWIQAELLPNIGTDFPSAISKMAGNLSEFNNTFSTNVRELRSTLRTVNDSYVAQTELLERIKGWKIDRIATANAEIYDKLKNSTEEIGSLVNHLQSLNVHINQQNDNSQHMATILNSWETEIESRKSNISKAVAKVDDYLKENLNTLKESSDVIVTDMTKNFSKQVDILNNQVETLPKLVKELDNLSSIKDSFHRLEQATENQNRKIDDLTNAIRELAQTKVTGGTVSFANPFMHVWKRIPKWGHWLLVIFVSLIPLYCLVSLIFFFVNLL